MLRAMQLSAPRMSDKMVDMRRVSVRELQQQMRRILERVQRGETVEITKRNKVVARLSPARAVSAPSPWPDLNARARKIFGRRVLSPGGSDAVLEGRGSR